MTFVTPALIGTSWRRGAGPRIVHVAPTVVDGKSQLSKRDEPSRVLVIQNEEFDLVAWEPRLGIVYQSLQIHRDGRRLFGAVRRSHPTRRRVHREKPGAGR